MVKPLKRTLVGDGKVLVLKRSPFYRGHIEGICSALLQRGASILKRLSALRHVRFCRDSLFIWKCNHVYMVLYENKLNEMKKFVDV